MLSNFETPLVTYLADLIAAVIRCAAMVTATEGIEITLRADAAALGDFGEGQRGEAQKVIDKAHAVLVAEVLTGHSCQAADETRNVATRATESVGNSREGSLAIG